MNLLNWKGQIRRDLLEIFIINCAVKYSTKRFFKKFTYSFMADNEIRSLKERNTARFVENVHNQLGRGVVKEKIPPKKLHQIDKSSLVYKTWVRALRI